MTKISFGQLIMQFQKSGFFPPTYQSITCGLGERPINPSEADAHQLCVDHDWQDSTIREQFDILLCITTAVVLITLGFMTLGVWHERDSGIAATIFSFFSLSNKRAQK